MLETIDVNKKMDHSEFKEIMERLQPKLGRLQRKCKELDIPVIIVFEGFSASGKGEMIAKLIEPLDPRGFNVYATKRITKKEKDRPTFWRFFNKTPAKGEIAIFDRSWYTKVLRERFEGLTTKEELSYLYDEIVDFEKLLVDDGTVIIKIFLHISKEVQKERFEQLAKNQVTAWRVTKKDLKQNKKYDKYQKINEIMIQKTDRSYAPWTIIEAKEKHYAFAKMYQLITDQLEMSCKKKEEESKEEPAAIVDTQMDPNYINQVLSKVDLNKEISKTEYKEKIDQLQEELASLQEQLYRKKIPAVFVFEGWDAAGKGGAIKRVTRKLDPRAYEVIPISAPDATQRAHHYLWRFYQKLPEPGHIAIFDRSWYGRVMVERIEGFATKEEVSRAYQEINHFEEQLVHANTIVLKFWLHIDKEEQEIRFQERQENVEKQWKITDEDWRNRAKWDQYELSVNEMLVRTSTTYAPWIVVEANSKQYARIKILESIIHSMKDKLNQVL